MNEHRSPAPEIARRRSGGAANTVLVLVILELTLATAYIHLTLGGLLFLLNGLGYVALGAAYAVAAAAPIAIVQRFAWLPRVALAGYTLVTIAAYVVMGPYFALGWVAKAIEVAIVGLLSVDVLRAYGSPSGLVRASIGSLSPARFGEQARRA